MCKKCYDTVNAEDKNKVMVRNSDSSKWECTDRNLVEATEEKEGEEEEAGPRVWTKLELDVHTIVNARPFTPLDGRRGTSSRIATLRLLPHFHARFAMYAS